MSVGGYKSVAIHSCYKFLSGKRKKSGFHGSVRQKEMNVIHKLGALIMDEGCIESCCISVRVLFFPEDNEVPSRDLYV
jgi:hypothetical protein